MIGKFLMIAGAAIGGIYITSEEGKKVRKALEKKKSIFKPIIEDLIKQANNALDGKEEIKSKEVRANVEFVANEVKNSLVELELDSTIEIIRDAIKVSSRKIREAFDDIENDKTATKKKDK